MFVVPPLDCNSSQDDVNLTACIKTKLLVFSWIVGSGWYGVSFEAILISFL
jgi:hypothetical protein